MHSIGGPELQYSLSFAPAEVGNSAAAINNAAYFMTGQNPVIAVASYGALSPEMLEPSTKWCRCHVGKP